MKAKIEITAFLTYHDERKTVCIDLSKKKHAGLIAMLESGKRVNFNSIREEYPDVYDRILNRVIPFVTKVHVEDYRENYGEELDDIDEDDINWEADIYDVDILPL